MKMKCFQAVLLCMIVILFTTSLFTFVPVSYAQSSQTWSDPINLSNAGSSTNPAMVIDATGTIHVIWIDQFEGYKYSKSTDGVTWTTPKPVRFPFAPTNTTTPVFFPDRQGVIHALWQNEETKALYYSRVTSDFDVPSNWMVGLKLADLVLDFDAAMSSQGVLHIGYVVGTPDPENNSNQTTKKDARPTGVYYRRLTGFIWSNPQALYSSQYFRALKPEDANIRLALSENKGLETVYMAWDDRPQKQILLSKSIDAGSSWSESQEVVLPESSSGSQLPFDVGVNTLNGGLLLIWQVGDPGTKCIQYSRWSHDGGENWEEPIKMFDQFSACPEKTQFISVEPNYSVALGSTQGDLSLIAWNGTGWSEPEVQSGLSVISNPNTFDSIIFGCKQVSSYKGRLFVVGCDQGSGGDIWFTSRKLDPLESLFPSPSVWSLARDVTTSPHKILSLTSVANQEDSIHVLWVEAPTLETEQVEPNIQYAQGNGGVWSKPTSVINGLDGLPTDLSVTIDQQQRLLLVWVDANTGDLLFSWADSNRAYIPSEWASPIILPSPSKLNDTPDILVDASGKIVVAYAVAVNENRGIYLTQSNDSGQTWSSPVTVFDATLAGWDGVDRPKITLTGDGHLHVVFHRVSVLGSHQNDGLYYSQSSDGGISWNAAETVSDQWVRWSEIVGYDEQVIHRLWQQVDKSNILTFHQISRDGGQTWDAPVQFSTNSAAAPEPALSIDPGGNLHFMQLVPDVNQVFQDLEWSGTRWRSLDTGRLSTIGLNTPAAISGGVTPNGILYTLLLFERADLKVKFQSELLNANRSLNLTGNPQSPSLPSIAIPNVTPVPTASSDLPLNPTPLSPLADLAEPSLSVTKNVVGLILVLTVIIMILVFVLPRRKKILK